MKVWLFRAVLFSVISLASGLSFALAKALPMGLQTDGYYVGNGDGATVVIHFVNKHTAYLGSVNEYSGIGFKPAPLTPSLIASAVTPSSGWKMNVAYQPNKHTITLTTVTDASMGKNGVCTRTYKVVDGKLLPISAHTLSGCNAMHGASWGYTPPLPNQYLTLRK